MSNKITVTFASSYDNAKEAITAAAPYLETSTAAFLRSLHFWAVFGIVVIAILAAINFAFGLTTRISIFYALLSASLLAFGFLALPTILDRNLYKRFEHTEEGARATADIDATGLTLRTSHSNWFIAWHGIAAVFETRNTVGIVHAMGPIYIPKTALDDPAAVVAQMRQWHQAGRPA